MFSQVFLCPRREEGLHPEGICIWGVCIQEGLHPGGGLHLEGSTSSGEGVSIHGVWADPHNRILRNTGNERAVRILLECIHAFLSIYIKNIDIKEQGKSGKWKWSRLYTKGRFTPMVSVNAATTLQWRSDPVLIENNGFASEWGSSRLVSPVSCSVDADAQCKQALIGCGMYLFHKKSFNRYNWVQKVGRSLPPDVGWPAWRSYMGAAWNVMGSLVRGCSTNFILISILTRNFS